MSIQPWYSLMSMETGVEGGSSLVPEVVWVSSAWMRVLDGFIMLPIGMFIGVCLSLDSCMELMSMPGMFGVEGCCCWAARVSGANTTSESRVQGPLLNMTDLSSEDVNCRHT
jgi:hypothetical protein